MQDTKYLALGLSVKTPDRRPASHTEMSGLESILHLLIPASSSLSERGIKYAKVGRKVL